MPPDSICGPQRQLLDLNEIVGEMVALLRGEALTEKDYREGGEVRQSADGAHSSDPCEPDR